MKSVTACAVRYYHAAVPFILGGLADIGDLSSFVHVSLKPW